MAIYANKVVEQYVNELLDTKLAVEGWVEVDTSLVAQPGDTIQVWRYTGSGNAERVAEGEGNSDYSDIDGVAYEYKVGTIQDRCKITDEEAARQPYAAEKKLDVVGSHIINFNRNDIVNEWYKSNNDYFCEGEVPTFNELMTAVGQLDLGVDDGFNGGAESYKIICSPAAWRAFSVGLTANVLVQYDMINGKMQPRINGIAVDVTDLLKGKGAQFLLVTNKAVRLVKGKSVSAESERKANIRTTEYYVRDNCVPYLEFVNKVVRLGKGFDITASAAEHGTFTVQKNAFYQDVVAVTATPAEGYVLKTIAVADSKSQSIEVADGKFEMPADDVTVTVTFEAAE